MAVVPIGAEVRRLDVVDVGAGREPGIVFHRVWRGHHSPGILYRRAKCKLIDVQDYGGGVCPVSLPLHHEVRRPRLFSKPAQSREGGGRCYRHRAVGGLGGKTLRLDEAPGLVESLGQRRTSPPRDPVRYPILFSNSCMFILILHAIGIRFAFHLLSAHLIIP